MLAIDDSVSMGCARVARAGLDRDFITCLDQLLARLGHEGNSPLAWRGLFGDYDSHSALRQRLPDVVARPPATGQHNTAQNGEPFVGWRAAERGFPFTDLREGSDDSGDDSR